MKGLAHILGLAAALFAAVGVASAVQAQVYPEQDRQVASAESEAEIIPAPTVGVSIFVAEGCEKCVAVEQEFIPQLQEEFGEALDVRYYSIETPENYDLLLYLEQQFSYLESPIPVAFVGKEVLRGKEEIVERLRPLVEEYLEKGGVGFPAALRTISSQPLQLHQNIYLAYFYTPGCRKCDRVKYMLDNLERSHPNLKIRRFNSELKESMKLNEALSELFDVPEQKRLLVPSVFVGNVYLAEEDLTDVNIRRLIEEFENTGTVSPWAEAERVMGRAEQGIIQRFQTLGPFAVVIAGLIDGINPCAFATLIFFLSYLTLVGRKGKDLVITAAAYITAVFTVYFLIGIGLFHFIHSLEIFSSLSRIIYLLAAVLAFALGVFSLYDFWMARKGDYRKVKLQLPGFLKKRLHRTIREKTKSSRIVLAAIATGVVVSFLELECTGQVYLPTICFVVGVPELKARAIQYLALYNLMFIIPLVIIFVLAYFGTTSERIAAAMREHFAAIKIGTALFFFGLGVLLIALL